MSLPERPRIVVGSGPRACEAALFETLEEELDSLGSRVLSRPLCLLVPSHSLRQHLLTRLARRRAGLVGLDCLTLRGLARDLLERRGESPLPGGWMLPVLVRRLSRRQPSLRASLDHLHDGYGALVGTVTDLLEAGLDPAHAEAVDEALAEEGRLVASVAAVQRARGLVEVARAAREELAQRGLGHVSALLQRATELLRGSAGVPMESSGIHVYGFADATGVATDLIEAVLHRFGGTVYLDRPADPTDPGVPDPSCEFGRRFAERLADLAGRQPDTRSADRPAEIRLLEALGGTAEVREVAWRIRQLLDDGARPEEIGVVARRLEPYRTDIRTHFDRLGLPYSALRAGGPLLPEGRRVRALLHLLNRRQGARLERWLDARAEGRGAVEFDLRLALHGLGLSRLQDLAELERSEVFDRPQLPLPVRLGFSADEEGGETRLNRRQIPTAEIRRARRRVREICELFDDWTGTRPWSDHRSRLERLLELLDWRQPRPPLPEVRLAVDALAQGIPPSLELDLDELTQTLTEALAGIGLDRFGGQGGGVQILDVTEARGRTFEHLFVLGMNRGVFPRTVREDPALPDELRGILGRHGHGVLPDLARKRDGFAEERFLFAQLCSASPRVTLSWQIADDSGRELATSPLVDRLLWLHRPDRAGSPLSDDADGGSRDRPRTELEHAVRAALRGNSRQLIAALGHAQPSDLSVPPAAVAAARWSVVSELDRPPSDQDRLGPYFGFVGPAGDAADPRRSQPTYITTLESLAICPWRTFLERLLRLEALPDPVEVLPGIDPLLIGQVVHRVLERIADLDEGSVVVDLAAARQSEPTTPSWPDGETLSRLLEQQAAAVTRGQGIDWPGFSDILAEISLPFLEVARQILADDPEETAVVATELDAAVPISDEPGADELRFKVDRVDNVAGRLLLTDFKTGRRGFSQAKTAKTRERHLLAAIRAGRLLQAAAYARAAGGAEDRGRYLFLHPDFLGSDEDRIVTVGGGDRPALEAFELAVSTLDRAWRAGLFFPRLVEPRKDQAPRACDYCPVVEACVQGDSGMRRRLSSWTRRGESADELERTLLETWLLPTAGETRR